MPTHVWNNAYAYNIMRTCIWTEKFRFLWYQSQQNVSLVYKQVDHNKLIPTKSRMFIEIEFQESKKPLYH